MWSRRKDPNSDHETPWCLHIQVGKPTFGRSVRKSHSVINPSRAAENNRPRGSSSSSGWHHTNDETAASFLPAIFWETSWRMTLRHQLHIRLILILEHNPHSSWKRKTLICTPQFLPIDNARQQSRQQHSISRWLHSPAPLLLLSRRNWSPELLLHSAPSLSDGISEPPTLYALWSTPLVASCSLNRQSDDQHRSLPPRWRKTAWDSGCKNKNRKVLQSALKLQSANNKNGSKRNWVRGEETCGEGERPSETTTTTPRFGVYKEIRVWK